MSTTTSKPWTADELVRLPAGWRYEIDEGELVIMAPAGYRHNDVATNVVLLLGPFVRAHRLGKVLAGELGIVLRRAPQTLRAPDVAFFSTGQVARIGAEEGFPDVPPALAVEVHDPSEPDLPRKIKQYLEAGVRAVWVLDPAARTLTRHAAGEAARTWTDPESVVEEPLVQGFSCRLRELFGEG